MSRKRFMGLFAVLVGLVLGMVGSAQGFDPETFILATMEEIDTLDPAVTYANTTFRELYVLYDRLITYEGASIEPKPMVATHWEISDDGLTYTFYLRKDVKFHDGTPLTAKDVAYSIVRAIKIGKGPSGLYTGILDENSPEVVDDYTLRLHLRQPFPALIPLLGMTMGAIVNSEVVKQHEVNGDWGEAWLTEHEAGSGPYILESWERGQQMVLVANEDYWGGAPKIKRVIIKIVPEASTMRMLLERGEIDMATDLPLDIILSLQGTPGIVVDIVDGMAIQYLAFNCEKDPFNNKVLRQAVAYAIDYDAIIEGVYLGLGIPLRSPIPKPLLGYNETLPVYRYDPDEAKRLLKEAGVEKGLEINFLIAPFTNWQRVAMAVQADLKKIGIKVNIQQFAWPTYLQKIFHGEHDLCMMGWTPDYADPDQNMWTHLHSSNVGPGWNLAFYKNPDVDYWMYQSRLTADPTLRAQYLTMAQALAINDSPYIWLTQLKAIAVYRDWVKGYEVNPMMNFYVPFHHIYKEK